MKRNFQSKVDEKGMIRNRYNRIPQPGQDTKQERNKYHIRRHKINAARAENHEDCSFPSDVHQTIRNKIKHRLVIVSNNFLVGLNRFYVITTLTLGFAVVRKHASYSVRVKDF